MNNSRFNNMERRRIASIALVVFSFCVSFGQQQNAAERASESSSIKLNATDATPLVPFQYVLIDNQNPRHPHQTAVGDISGDGFVDIVQASGDGFRAGTRDGIWWWKYPAWTKTRIDTGSFSTDMQVGDIDGDGDLDVVATRGIDYGISVWWYENPRPTGSPDTAIWVRRLVGNALTHDVELADFNADGRLDIMVRNTTLTIFFQEAGLTWRAVIISQRPWEGSAAGDIDHDGDFDIAINGYWYQNPRPLGDPRFDVWTERVVATGWPVSLGVHIRDINLDGRNDILYAPSAGFIGRLSWYETTNPLTGSWTEHIIDPSVGCIHTFKTADIDLNGTIDVITGEGHYCSDPDDITVYLNNGGGLSWVEQVVATTGIHNLRIADIGSDGDMDIIGSNAHDQVTSHGSPLEMWENQILSPHASVKANVKVLLQGAYTSSGDSLRADIRSALPLSQPYSVAPWNYAGNELVPSIPPSVVDWILLELRTTVLPASVVARRAAFLRSDGTIVDLDGVSTVSFPTVTAGSYYIVVGHRNHLDVMSAAPVTLNTASALYDFSVAEGQGYGVKPQIAVSGSRYGLYAGDANSSNGVNSSDFIALLSSMNAIGYSAKDLNLSGIITAADLSLIFANSAKTSQVP